MMLAVASEREQDESVRRLEALTAVRFQRGEGAILVGHASKGSLAIQVVEASWPQRRIPLPVVRVRCTGRAVRRFLLALTREEEHAA
jgi:hypothetical protein